MGYEFHYLLACFLMREYALQILRPWVLNCVLVPLVKAKPYFLDLLNKGIVDALFRDIHRFRVRALLGDSSTHGCLVRRKIVRPNETNII
jgi:hypothetical protein